MPQARSHEVKGNLRAYLELTVAMVLVGSSVVVGKLMAASLPVFLAGGLSSAIGAAILVPVLLRREGGLPAVGGRDVLVLFLQALTGIFLFRVLLLWGLLFTTAAEGGVITSTTPAVVGLISFVFLKGANTSLNNTSSNIWARGRAGYSSWTRLAS
jgi:drug/metabolite transporter (DMT)-like permease